MQGFTDDPPLIWAEPVSQRYSVIRDGSALRFQEKRLPNNKIFVIFVVFLLAIVPVGGSIALIHEFIVESAILAMVEDGCGEEYIEDDTVLQGQTYCVDPVEPYTYTLDSLEVSEDQHVREIDGEDVWEYRWEDVDNYVVFGVVDEDAYYCYTFLPQTNLGGAWTYADLSVPEGSLHPEWCFTSFNGTERNYSSERPHPYDGVWLYYVGDGDPQQRLEMHKNDGLNISSIDPVSLASLESEGGGFPIELCLTVPLSILLLAAADPRKRGIYFHANTGRFVRKRVGKLPSFQTTWDEVDFSSTKLQRRVRVQRHIDEGHKWTTEHPGFDLVISRRNGPIVPVFFEDGGNPQLHESTILALLKGLDVDEQRYRSHLEADEAESIEAAVSPVQNAEAKDGAASGVLFTDAGDNGEDGPSRSSIHETTKPKLPEPDSEANAFWSDIG